MEILLQSPVGKTVCYIYMIFFFNKWIYREEKYILGIQRYDNKYKNLIRWYGEEHSEHKLKVKKKDQEMEDQS